MMDKKENRPVIGIDLGGTNIQVGILTGKNRIRSRVKIKTKADLGPSEVIARLAQAIEDSTRQAGLKMKSIAAIGIGAPGTIDPEKGRVEHAVNLRWRKIPLASALRKELKLHTTFPVLVDNDVNAAVWGEYMAGAGKNYPHMLGVWIGTGIGGGLILNGNLFYGHYFSAGEIGHTLLNADAPLGRRTLENAASRTAIVNLLSQLITSNHPSKLSDMVEGDILHIRSRAIAKALEANDHLTQTVIQQAAKYVGIAIANTVTLLSLPRVVIGGGLTDSLGEPWLQWIQESFWEHVFPAELRQCSIVRSRLGEDAGIIGAALLAREKLWKKRPSADNCQNR